MKKLFVLILIIFSFSLYSQKYTYVLTNENAIAKDNVTKQIKDQSTAPFKVYLTLTTYGGGSVVIENGAVIMLTQQYDRNDITQDYHYRGVDDSYLNCSVHLNTKYEGIYSYNVFTSFQSLVNNLNESSADISIWLCELTDEKGLEFIDEMFMIERVIDYSSGNTQEYDVTISALNSDEENEILLTAFDNMLRKHHEKYASFHRTPQFYKINTIKK